MGVYQKIMEKVICDCGREMKPTFAGDHIYYCDKCQVYKVRIKENIKKEKNDNRCKSNND